MNRTTITSFINEVFKNTRNVEELQRFDRYRNTKGLRGSEMKFVIYKNRRFNSYFTNIEIGTVSEILSIKSDYIDSDKVLMILDGNHECIYYDETRISKAII